MKKTEEFIKNIKTIRINEWNEIFTKKIKETREKELKELIKMSVCLTIVSAIGYLASPLCIGATLTYYVL